MLMSAVHLLKQDENFSDEWRKITRIMIDGYHAQAKAEESPHVARQMQGIATKMESVVANEGGEQGRPYFFIIQGGLGDKGPQDEARP
jgi:hypothetical protein